MDSPNHPHETSAMDVIRLSILRSLYKNQKIQIATAKDNTTWTHCFKFNFTLNQFIVIIREYHCRLVLLC